MSARFFKIWSESKWLQEKSSQYSIPFISLQGSRACFPKKEFTGSTDYDVRFLYAKEPHDYFTYKIGRNKDTLEHTEELEINGEIISVEFVGWDISKFIELGKKSNPYCHAFIENIPKHFKYLNSCEILMTLRTFLSYYNCQGTLLKSYLGQMISTDLKTRSLDPYDPDYPTNCCKLIYNSLICYSRLEMVKQSPKGEISPQFDIYENLGINPDKELEGLFWRTLKDRVPLSEIEVYEMSEWISEFLRIESSKDYGSYSSHAFTKEGQAQESFVKLVKLFNSCDKITI